MQHKQLKLESDFANAFNKKKDPKENKIFSQIVLFAEKYDR